MPLKKNIKLGKNKNNLFISILFLFLFFSFDLRSDDNLEGTYTNLKVLDKISSKNILIRLKNNEEIRHKDLLIKSMKCKNSEFDDNPEITAYIQVIDLTNKNKDDVFIFNGWTFASDPSLKPFDHAIYDLQLLNCSKA